MKAAISAAASGVLRLGGDRPVHRLGFGAMRITGPGIWGPPADREECRKVLRRAVELGTSFIDTAESYGPHVSEELIAEALHPYPLELTIATKGGLDRPGPDRWQPNCRPERLRQELEGSLRRLRIDCIDLYQLHRIDPAVPEADQFGELQQFQREGKIRQIGLSEVAAVQIERAETFFAVVSVQNRYNLVDREWEPVLEYCNRRRIAFIPWFPLQAGRTDETGGPMADIARRHQATPSQIALAWLLRRSPVMLPIPGTSKVDHLEENMRAAALTLTDEEYEALAGAAG